MAARDTGAEQAIKDAAKRIFFGEGRLHATTQDIANGAGVNRTLLNYYFRTREALFEEVYREGMQDMKLRMDEALAAELPFREKVERLIDVFLGEVMQYPYREVFVITEINQQSGPTPARKGLEPVFGYFAEDVRRAMDDGLIRPSANPFHFVINLFALMSYPVIMRPLNTDLLGIDDGAYQTLLAERKQEILGLLFL